MSQSPKIIQEYCNLWVLLSSSHDHVFAHWNSHKHSQPIRASLLEYVETLSYIRLWNRWQLSFSLQQSIAHWLCYFPKEWSCRLTNLVHALVIPVLLPGQTHMLTASSASAVITQKTVFSSHLPVWSVECWDDGFTAWRWHHLLDCSTARLLAGIAAGRAGLPLLPLSLGVAHPSHKAISWSYVAHRQCCKASSHTLSAPLLPWWWRASVCALL